MSDLAVKSCKAVVRLGASRFNNALQASESVVVSVQIFKFRSNFTLRLDQILPVALDFLVTLWSICIWSLISSAMRRLRPPSSLCATAGDSRSPNAQGTVNDKWTIESIYLWIHSLRILSAVTLTNFFKKNKKPKFPQILFLRLHFGLAITKNRLNVVFKAVYCSGLCLS